VCELDKVGTCQVIEQEMIMVTIVMTTKWTAANDEFITLNKFVSWIIKDFWIYFIIII
jgi:hypothetical protein